MIELQPGVARLIRAPARGSDYARLTNNGWGFAISETREELVDAK